MREKVQIDGRTVHIDYERGDEGLWYAASDDVPGLFVCGQTLDDCRREAWLAAQRLLSWSFTVTT